MTINDLADEVKQALKEEMLKFVGHPANERTAKKMEAAIMIILDFYDVLVDPVLTINGTKITLSFKRRIQ